MCRCALLTSHPFSFLCFECIVVQKDFCVVCTSMYVCNTVIFLASLLRWWGLGKEGQQHVKQA